MSDHKLRVKNAIDKYLKKQETKYGPKRTNEKPEKEVEKTCMELMKSWGWSVEVYEAKATFDPRRGVWRQQAMKAGTSDCMGSTDEGISVAIEFKAKGSLSTLRPRQR